MSEYIVLQPVLPVSGAAAYPVPRHTCLLTHCWALRTISSAMPNPPPSMSSGQSPSRRPPEGSYRIDRDA